MMRLLNPSAVSKLGWMTVSMFAALSMNVVQAQQTKPAAASVPDWSGVWAPGRNNFGGGGPGGATPGPQRPGGPTAGPGPGPGPGSGAPPMPQIPPSARPSIFSLTPEYQALFDKLRQEGGPPEDQRDCVPPGIPVLLMIPAYPIEFFITPEKVVVTHEYMNQTRRIFTDGRKHPPPDELELTYNGHSIGHWEGDTLVVHTIGFKTRNLFDDYSKRSDVMEVVERIRRVAPDRMENQVTLTDAKALAKPFTRTFYWDLKPGWQLTEFDCSENNRKDGQ